MGIDSCLCSACLVAVHAATLCALLRTLHPFVPLSGLMAQHLGHRDCRGEQTKTRRAALAKGYTMLCYLLAVGSGGCVGAITNGPRQPSSKTQQYKGCQIDGMARIVFRPCGPDSIPALPAPIRRNTVFEKSHATVSNASVHTSLHPALPGARFAWHLDPESPAPPVRLIKAPCTPHRSPPPHPRPKQTCIVWNTRLPTPPSLCTLRHTVSSRRSRSRLRHRIETHLRLHALPSPRVEPLPHVESGSQCLHRNMSMLKPNRHQRPEHVQRKVLSRPRPSRPSCILDTPMTWP
jgi:hypothetical protein